MNVKLAGLDIQDPDDIHQGDRVGPEGRRLDFPDAGADRGNGARVSHVHLVGAEETDGHPAEPLNALIQGSDKGCGFIRQHGAGRIAERDGPGSGTDGFRDDGTEESHIAAGGVFGNELHVIRKLPALPDRIGDSGNHGLRLHVGKVFHLDGTDRGRHLEARPDGVLQRFPGDPDTVFIQRHRHGNPGVHDGGADGFDQQAVNLDLPDFIHLYHINIQAVNQTAQLQLLPEAEIRQAVFLPKCTVRDGHNLFFHIPDSS